MKTPNPLWATAELVSAIADYYEFSMAMANMEEGIAGKQSVFDLVLRNVPSGRSFMVNAGLEQAAAYLLTGKGNSALKQYLEEVQGVSDREFLSWSEDFSFKGDLYAMPEGTIFFGQEPQLRVHERFEEAQVFESLLLNTVNPQTNVATTANDIASVTNKILLEGGSRRATSPQSALFNSRAARIGGFTASSNVAFGMEYGEKVGGTHGHSYIMLHPTEYAAFKAQEKTLGKEVCFLLDTYDVGNALETVLKIVEEDHLSHFALRIDSGDLLEQALMIHQRLKARGVERSRYTLIASDDLTADKITNLERGGADIDKYLVGTYVVNPAKPLGGVYKLAAFLETNGNWELRGKISENPRKATLPGIKQVYRVTSPDGYYRHDVIALEGEDLSRYIPCNSDRVEELLIPIIKDGVQVYDFPTLNEISARRKKQLSLFREIKGYETIVSERIKEEQEEIRQRYGQRAA